MYNIKVLCFSITLCTVIQKDIKSVQGPVRQYVAALGNVLIHEFINYNNCSAGATPLHLAACFGNTVVMRILLDSGAEEEAVDKRGGDQVNRVSLVAGWPCL